MSVQHNTFYGVSLLIFTGFVAGCGGGAVEDNKVTLSVSLGPHTDYPANAQDDQDELYYYWGRIVKFSVQGLDEGVNDEVNEVGSADLQWTGADSSDGTLYASYTFKLKANGGYPGGRFKFKTYIDWNDDGNISSGDVYFNSYTIYADQDDDDDTQEVGVEPGDWGSHISYEEHDNSIVIDDPLNTTIGTPWKVVRIGEGELAILDE